MNREVWRRIAQLLVIYTLGMAGGMAAHWYAHHGDHHGQSYQDQEAN